MPAAAQPLPPTAQPLPPVVRGAVQPQQGNPIPQISPPPQLPVGPGLAAPQSEPLTNLAPNTPRRVTSAVVEGSTILSDAEAAALVGDVVGPAVPTSAIEAGRLALLKRYRDASYPLVTVSASLAADGKLRFTITEGRIAEVQLDGNIGPSGVKVLEFLNRLVRPGPVDSAALERWLLLAQDVPGVTLQTVLRPSESEPGALTLVARVSRAAISGFITADNRAYRYTGPEQALGVVGYNGLTSLGDRTEISLFKSIYNTAQIFGQVATEAYVGSSGLKLRFYAGAGDTQPTGTLHSVGYDGQTVVAGAQASYPVIYTRQQKLNVVGLFDMVQSVVYQNGAINSKDSLRVIRLGADYALQDLLLGASRPAVNQIVTRLSHGLEGLGASHTGSTSLGRSGSNVGFTKFSAELSRTQTLFSPWSDASVAFMGLIAGQASQDVIPSAEKFYLGGLRFTRGFYAGQVTGDNAMAATAELQLNTGFQGDFYGTPLEVGLQFYTFYDWGETWENKSLDPNARLRSFGIGLRTTLTQYTEIDIEGVSRMTRMPSGTTGAVAPLGGQAFYWRLIGRF